MQQINVLKNNRLNNPLVSIICPVYNAESYLSQTLKSILTQTYKNIELIIVDDGSTDRSLDLCKKEAETDSRIKVFHTENQGVSHARNYAMEQAQGEYISFVDSDDLIKPVMIEKLMDAIRVTSKKIAICDYWNGKRHSLSEFIKYCTVENPIIEKVDFDKYRFTNKYTHTVIWGGIYEHELIRNMKFCSQLYVGEDTLFFAEALKKARSLVYVNDKYYYYSFRPSSLVNKKYNQKHMTEILAWEKLCEVFSDEKNEFVNECKARLGWTCIRNYEKAYMAGTMNRDCLDDIYRKTKLYVINILLSKYLILGKKIYTLAFVLCPKITVKIFHNNV